MAGIVERYDFPERYFWLRGPHPDRTVEYDARTGLWNVFGHPEAVRILADPETFSSDTMRLMQDIVDLYDRVPASAPIVVL